MIAEGRSETTELLSEDATSLRLAEVLCGLANASGGILVLGVPDGLPDLPRARERLSSAAAQVDPPLTLGEPEHAESGGRAFLLQRVAPSLSRVHSAGGRFFGRSRTGQRVLRPPQVRQLMAERGETAFEMQVPPGAGMDDLDLDRAAVFLQTLVPGEPVEDGLRRRGCIVDHDGALRPTFAGVLMFGRDPARFCPGCEIVAVRYAGATMSDEFLRDEIRGALPDQIRRAEAFLTSNIRRGVRIHSLVRSEAPEYPLEAVREAVVNAVAHRDYGIQADSIRIIMFSDRIEFYSPGRLPGHMTVQNILEERYSRNPHLVQMLSDMGFIERLGYGIDRMLKRMAESGLPRPVFQETVAGFRVTLHGHGDRFVATSGEAHRWAILNLNERQSMAMAHLSQAGRITNRDFQDLCPDVSAETIRRDLADLVSRGLLLRIGDKRATYYILK
jgi:ATP-dependent DNA helicase RecG